MTTITFIINSTNCTLKVLQPSRFYRGNLQSILGNKHAIMSQAATVAETFLFKSLSKRSPRTAGQSYITVDEAHPIAISINFHKLKLKIHSPIVKIKSNMNIFDMLLFHSRMQATNSDFFIHNLNLFSTFNVYRAS